MRARNSLAGLHSGSGRRIRLFASLGGLLIGTAASAQDWAPNLTLTSTWQDNATNAKPAADRISGLQVEADIVASQRYSLGRNDSLHPTAHLAAEWWPRFDGLARGGAGVRLQWQHKFGLGALAPVFGVEAGVDEFTAKERFRRGTGSALLVTLRKRFDPATRLSLTQEFTDYNARHAVFDRKGSETALEIARDLATVTRVSLRLAYRDGDVLSHATPPRPDLVELAPNRLSIDTFGRPLTAYSIEARTIGAKVAVIHAIDTSSAVVLGYEWRKTDRSPLRYVNQLVSLAIVYQY